MSDRSRRPSMSYDEVAIVLGRALQDEAFRDALLADPKRTIERDYPDFTPGPATVEFFRSLGKEFGQAAATLKRARDAIGGAGDM
ncbi:MAG: hypothetical protein RQ966_17150 [Acetobacteraceae bacterium]|nr:hypothetical protein [Acetobacteraceae bacterium]